MINPFQVDLTQPFKSRSVPDKLRSASLLFMAAAAQISISPFAGRADLSGVRLWYTDSGGEGVPVISLHANTGNTDSWHSRTIRVSSKAGYRGYRVRSAPLRPQRCRSGHRSSAGHHRKGSRCSGRALESRSIPSRRCGGRRVRSV